jgi:phage-related baseplate assembly protein
VSVCLTGSLEDFSIQDILQIIAFGRKTGCLSLETEATGGSIVFQKGRVLASVDDGGAPPEADLRLLHGHERDQVIRRRIAASLDRFSRSRRGDFSFLACAQPPRVIDGRDIAPETLDTGIDVIDLLLELVSSEDWPGAA